MCIHARMLPGTYYYNSMSLALIHLFDREETGSGSLSASPSSPPPSPRPQPECKRGRRPWPWRWPCHSAARQWAVLTRSTNPHMVRTCQGQINPRNEIK